MRIHTRSLKQKAFKTEIAFTNEISFQIHLAIQIFIRSLYSESFHCPIKGYKPIQLFFAEKYYALEETLRCRENFIQFRTIGWWGQAPQLTAALPDRPQRLKTAENVFNNLSFWGKFLRLRRALAAAMVKEGKLNFRKAITKKKVPNYLEVALPPPPQLWGVHNLGLRRTGN